MEAKLERMSEGLAGKTTQQESVDLTGGIPKPVKKTFAEQMSKAELDQRKKGSAVATNSPGVAPRKAASSEAQPQISSQQPRKPGDIDAFKGWVKDL